MSEFRRWQHDEAAEWTMVGKKKQSSSPAIPLTGANAIPVSNSNLVGGPRNGLNSPLPRQSVFNRLNIGVTSNSNNQIAGILGKAPCCLLHLSVLDVWPVIISGPTAKISLDVWPVTVLSILLVTAGSRLD
jgi:hypothetical protein